MNDHRMKSAPNYTNAALTMLGVNLMWVFMVIWALLGYVAVLVVAALLNTGITWLASRTANRP